MHVHTCLYPPISSCSLSLWVLVTSFFNTATTWKFISRYLVHVAWKEDARLRQAHKHEVLWLYSNFLGQVCIVIHTLIVFTDEGLLYTSWMFREVTRSSTSCKVFLRTSRSGDESTRRISITNSYVKQKQNKPQVYYRNNCDRIHTVRTFWSQKFKDLS